MSDFYMGVMVEKW